MRFAFDVDGVIFGWDITGGYHPTKVGSVLPGCIETLTWVKERGHDIVIFSCRANPEVNNSWGFTLSDLLLMLQSHLVEHNIPYDFVSVFKPDATWFFDDRSNFISWDKVKEKIMELENEH